MKNTILREKLSTTVSRDTHRYLKHLVAAGRARTIAEAVDLVVRRVRQAENRARLERDTAAYFANLPAKAADEEVWLERILACFPDDLPGV